jgi:nickel transport protein
MLMLLLSVTAPLHLQAEGVQHSPSETAAGAEAQQQDCGAVLAILEEQNRQLHQELRQIKRELGVLNQNLEKPGAREIVTGVGFILGLSGTAALLMARRRPSTEGER